MFTFLALSITLAVGDNNQQSKVQAVQFKPGNSYVIIKVAYGYQPEWIVYPDKCKVTYDGKAIVTSKELITKLRDADYVYVKFTSTDNQWVAATAEFTTAIRPTTVVAPAPIVDTVRIAVPQQVAPVAHKKLPRDAKCHLFKWFRSGWKGCKTTCRN